jgi:hypothetical protein
MLAQHQCGGIVERGGELELWKAVAAVCAAAVDGDLGQWDVAERAAAAAEGTHLSDGCLDQVVTDLLQRALDWHRRHPGGRPKVRFQEVAGETDCGGAENRRRSSTDGSPASDGSTPTEETAPPDQPTPPDGTAPPDQTTETTA